MEIKPVKVSIRDIVNGYNDAQENGCLGLCGRLNIRPPYQREFVYNEKQSVAVINSIKHNFPLNSFYWSVNKDSDSTTYEVLDGQQRTVSICKYVNNEFSVNFQFFHNLTEDEKNQILDYNLFVYLCSGTENEKLEWFKVINIAGEKLTDQELRNAVYTGPWLNDAKKYFSKQLGPAYNLAKNYMKGSPIRQDYLETVIEWVSNGNIESYMAEHQQDPNASKLWLYFNNVINWVMATFPKYRKEMKQVPWGKLYNLYKDNTYDTNTLEQKIVSLMIDDDVTKKSSIYEYLLSGEQNENILSIRAFTINQKREAYERQKGICLHCGKEFSIDEMEADHITPWSQGGKTISSNCQMLCKHCNRIKSNV